MDIDQLASRIADLRFPDGYVFENGTPHFEVLGRDRAAGLIQALHAKGYAIVPASRREDDPAGR